MRKVFALITSFEIGGGLVFDLLKFGIEVCGGQHQRPPGKCLQMQGRTHARTSFLHVGNVYSCTCCYESRLCVWVLVIIIITLMT